MVMVLRRRVVENYFDGGLGEGGRSEEGGGRPSGHDQGWYVEPTVFADVLPGQRIAQEEIFGPVLTVLTYENEDEAVAIANDSAYGLNGAVFTGDLAHGLAVAGRIPTGTIQLDGSPAVLRAPIGGVKYSGTGR